MREPRQLWVGVVGLLFVAPAATFANPSPPSRAATAMSRDEPPPTKQASHPAPRGAVDPRSLPPALRALRRHPAIGMRIFIGLGLGSGRLATEGVDEPYSDHKLLSSSTGSVQPALALMVQPSRVLQLAAIAELGGGFGHKSYGLLGPGDEWFGFWRAAGALLLSFNIPLSALHGDAIFVGGGPTVQHIAFADGSLTAVGGRIVAGYRFYEGTLQIDGFLAVDLVNTDARPRGEAPMQLGNPGWLLGFIVYRGVR